MKRMTYELRWYQKSAMWRLTIRHRGSESWGSFRMKRISEAHARYVAREKWTRFGIPTQLIIYNKDGRIGTGNRAEASYGCDSKKRRG